MTARHLTVAIGLVLVVSAPVLGVTKDQRHAQMLELARQAGELRPAAANDPAAAASVEALLAQYRQLSQSMGGDDPASLAGEGHVDGGAEGVGTPTPPNCATAAPGVGSNNTPVPIPDSGGPVATSTIAIAGAGPYLWDLDLTLGITHTFAADLDLTVMSPAGTIVTISTDNGGGNDNVWANTTFDIDANPGGQVPYANNNGMVTDHLYVNLVNVPLLTPEEAFAAFIGEDPNGVWTLTIDDDAGGDTGTLNSWSVNVVPCACGLPDADLSIFKSGVETVPGTVVYTIDVTNNGPADATGVVVTDPLPPELAYVSDDCGGTNVPPWTWNIGPLASGASVQCNITLSVVTPGAVSNTATVTGDQVDPTPANNSSTATMIVLGIQVPIIEIPTVGAIGLLALLAALAGCGLFLLRRRTA